MLMPKLPPRFRLHKQRPNPALVIFEDQSMPTERTNLFAYTEPTAPVGQYVGYVSLNRETDGSVSLTVRQPGDGTKEAKITLPYVAMGQLAGALKHDAMGLAGAGG